MATKRLSRQCNGKKALAGCIFLDLFRQQNSGRMNIYHLTSLLNPYQAKVFECLWQSFIQTEEI